MQCRFSAWISPFSGRLAAKPAHIERFSLPRRRYTAAELEFHGTARRNPARYASRTDHNTLAPLGYCPKFLTSTQKAIWKQLVSLAPAGLLTVADTFAVELAVRMIERSRQATSLKASEAAALMALLGRLGLTPADRAKLDIPAPPTAEESEWAEFA